MSNITVIVPVFEVEPYLHRCVYSLVSAQTFADFELVLVDDGSLDQCASMCDEYAAGDSRALVVHQQNGGLSAARNTGIDWATACSRSKWLAFVDSDDWVHPLYLEWLLRAVEEHGTKVAACDYTETSSYGVPPKLTYESKCLSWTELFIDNGSRASVAWNKLYDKNLFKELRYPVGRIHEDEFLTYKLLHCAGDLAFVPSPLYLYFKNSEGITKGNFSLARLDDIQAQFEFLTYVYANDISSLKTWVLRRYFFACNERVGQLVDADCVPKGIQESEGRRIRKQARMVMLRFGLFRLSPRLDYDSYSFVYPHLMLIARWPSFLMKRLRGMAPSNALK